MLRTTLLISLLAISVPVHAKLYKCTDAEGNTIYTDQPCAGGKELKLPPIQTYTPQQLPQNTNVDTTNPQIVVDYKNLVITKPAQDEVVTESTGKADVDFSSDPGLQQAVGHKFQLVLDGTRLPTQGVTNRVRLENLDPGAHRLKVVIIDGKGALLKESAETTFYMKRQSVLTPASPSGAPRATGATGAPRAPGL